METAASGTSATATYLLLAAVGAVMFYGSFRGWKRLVGPDTGERPLGILIWLYRIRGARGYRTGMMGTFRHTDASLPFPGFYDVNYLHSNIL